MNTKTQTRSDFSEKYAWRPRPMEAAIQGELMGGEHLFQALHFNSDVAHWLDGIRLPLVSAAINCGMELRHVGYAMRLEIVKRYSLMPEDFQIEFPPLPLGNNIDTKSEGLDWPVAFFGYEQPTKDQFYERYRTKNEKFRQVLNRAVRTEIEVGDQILDGLHHANQLCMKLKRIHSETLPYAQSALEQFTHIANYFCDIIRIKYGFERKE